MMNIVLVATAVILWSVISGVAGEIHDAVAQNNSARIESLLDSNPGLIDSKNNNGQTPLFVALDRGRNSMARLLIEKGADTGFRGYRNRTYLHMAARGGNAQAVRLLLDRGADVNARDASGKTPIQMVGRNMTAEITGLLAGRGADVNVRDDEGNTPLILMAALGEAEAVRQLIASGADTGIKDQAFGRTALHWAAINGNRAIAGRLVDSGSEVNVTDDRGVTPLQFAARYGHQGVATLLKSVGASSADLEENYGFSGQLQQPLASGEAVMWYLGHCGWAIKTANHLLIFDYIEQATKSGHPLLANGFVNPDEIADQNVTVFVTHGHGDHYDRAIFGWAGRVSNITYVYGFKPEPGGRGRPAGYSGPPYQYIGPRQIETVNGMEVITIESVDAGVGFLVKVDGLTIYHAGDHAGFRAREKEKYTREIDFLAANISKCDLAFVNATGCGSLCAADINESARYTLDHLSPAAWFPTHAGGREQRYLEFAAKLSDDAHRSRVVCALNRGDRFTFRDGKVVK